MDGEGGMAGAGTVYLTIMIPLDIHSMALDTSKSLIWLNMSKVVDRFHMGYIFRSMSTHICLFLVDFHWERSSFDLLPTLVFFFGPAC
jgi:hypothetical protein